MEDDDFEVDHDASNEDDISDEDNGNEESEEIEPMINFINSVYNDDLRDATNIFHNALGSKVRDALESERINVGSNMFSSEEDKE